MADTPRITGVDWDLVNEGAAGWARDHGGKLVKDISTTTRRGVGNAVGDFYTEAQTMGELTNSLGTIYSPQRAEMIAITEVTRSAAEGERAMAKELAKEGVVMVEVWETRNDDVVCEICRPRNGIEEHKGEGDAYWSRDMGPPGHPRCRCNVRHELPKPKEGAIEQSWVDDLDYSQLPPDQADAVRQGLLRAEKGYSGPGARFTNIRYDATGNFAARYEGNTLAINPKHFADVVGDDLRDINRYKRAVRRIDTLKEELAGNLDVWSAESITRAEYQINNMEKIIRAGKPIRAQVATSVEDVIVHEVGHGVQWDLGAGYYDDIDDFLPPSELHKRGIDFSSTLQSKLDKIAFDQGHLISEYATTNSEEYFAESVLAYFKGDKTGIHPDLLSILDKVLK